MDEFLFVAFPESRQLEINGFVQGWTNTTVRLDAGTYDVTLTGRLDFSPAMQRVVLRFSPANAPVRIQFFPLPPSAIPGAGMPPTARARRAGGGTGLPRRVR